jgi:flagellin-like protein
MRYGDKDNGIVIGLKGLNISMNISELFTDDSAVSPVIGVILMVAITVILAAVIGSFVLNLGGSLQQSAPQASFGFDYGNDTSVNITHQTGDSIEADRLNTTGIGTGSSGWTETSGLDRGETVSAGTTATFVNGDSDDWDGETVRVVWESENGESSATLSQSTAPTI